MIRPRGPGRIPTESARYNRHAEALRARHGDRVWRIGLDGGFSCPNRTEGGGGCSYCSGDGSRAPYLPAGPLSLASQVEAGMRFLERRYASRLFFLYFQAYSSTYAPVRVLEERYDEAIAAALYSLSRPGRAGADALRGLVVSTRPDCVDEERARLLESYADRGLELWVELGLQSARDATLRDIGRGHDYSAFERAVDLLRGRGLRIAAHVMLGLPGETEADMLSTVGAVSGLGLDGIKFHDLRILSGSRLASEFLAGEVSVFHPSRLPGLLADCIEVLDPACEVIRICADAPGKATIAPRPPPSKDGLYLALEGELARRGAGQGSRYGVSGAFTGVFRQH